MLHSAASITFASTKLAYITVASRTVFDALPGEAAEHDGFLSKVGQIGDVLVVFQWYAPKEKEER